MTKSRSTSGRQVIRQACDACRVRKIKCSGLQPCTGCTTSRIECTFKVVPKMRGPRSLRPKTVQRVYERQRERRLSVESEDNRGNSSSPSSTSQKASVDASQGVNNHILLRTPYDSLDLSLNIYHLRLYPVWPILEVSDLTSTLKNNEEDSLSYALANAVSAATIAQLKLDNPHNTSSASSMEAECIRVKDFRVHRQVACLNAIRISFFLHVYHENLEPGGVSSLSYLREAITLAQIVGLHRESTYGALSPSEQDLRRRIIWLLFVTERGVAILHHLPVVLRCNAHFPSVGSKNEGILPAFRKLLHLFWTFEQSGAFDVLQNIGNEPGGVSVLTQRHNSLEILQQRLQDVPIDREASNDVQRADICVTRHWMRALLWRILLLQHSDLFTLLCLPIQIAQEFLAVISKLPTTAIESHGPSIEFKIFEIASAVTDALSNVHLRTWAFASNTNNILSQLHGILMSCRGGNETLSMMLRDKITLIQNQALFSPPLNSRIQEVLELDNVGTVASADEDDADVANQSFSAISTLTAAREVDSGIFVFQRPHVTVTNADSSESIGNVSTHSPSAFTNDLWLDWATEDPISR